MTREEQILNVLQRREAALLDRRFRALARAGQPVARAFVPPIPQKMRVNYFSPAQQWT